MSRHKGLCALCPLPVPALILDPGPSRAPMFTNLVSGASQSSNNVDGGSNDGRSSVDGGPNAACYRAEVAYRALMKSGTRAKFVEPENRFQSITCKTVE